MSGVVSRWRLGEGTLGGSACLKVPNRYPLGCHERALTLSVSPRKIPVRVYNTQSWVCGGDSVRLAAPPRRRPCTRLHTDAMVTD